MKAIVKTGSELLFTEGYSNDWSDVKDELIINFVNRWTYESFKFNKKKNELVIYTIDGRVVLRFSAPVENIKFEYQVKEQLVFKIIKL